MIARRPVDKRGALRARRSGLLVTLDFAHRAPYNGGTYHQTRKCHECSQARRVYFTRIAPPRARGCRATEPATPGQLVDDPARPGAHGTAEPATARPRWRAPGGYAGL